MSAARPAVNVDAVLDAVHFAGLPLIVMVCMAIVLVLDGFDIQIIGFVAPALTAEFGIDRQALAPVLAASLLGMALGAFAVGPVGDRWGRRPALLASTVLFGGATLLGATASTLDALTLWRFLTGIGLGGALPNATALMAEFAPPKWRNQAIAAAIVGVPVGGMIGAAFAAEIVPVYGWRTLFVIGGALPLLAVTAMYFVLPESARFLATHAGRKRELVALLNRIEGREHYRPEDRYVIDTGAAEGSPAGLRTLFSRPFVRDTVATWLVFGTNIFAVYSFFSWAPTVLTALGLELATAVRGAFIFNLAGVLGSLANAWVIARLGSRGPIAAMAALAALALFYLAQLTAGTVAGGTAAGLSITALMSGIAVAGFAITAVQVGMYAVVAHVYPTFCRSSGVGWALGAGRLGGIVSAFAGGVLLTQGGGRSFFIGVAFVLLVTLASVLVIRRHVPGRTSATAMPAARAPR
jgi:AAHS family 4-hydroxybenzoate transporter-like MFS transporter